MQLAEEFVQQSSGIYLLNPSVHFVRHENALQGLIISLVIYIIHYLIDLIEIHLLLPQEYIRNL